MNPVSMIKYFFGKVYGYVKAGLDWRLLINDYERAKTHAVAKNYRFHIFPLDFISVRRSEFAMDNTVPGSRGDYAQTVIYVDDIYPFILNAHSSAVLVRSFRKSNPSAFDGMLLEVGYGYVHGKIDKKGNLILGPDGKWLPIDANHVGFDKPGTPGILTFYVDNAPMNNRQAHTITETGKAYALAPNVEPNIITKAQVLVKGKNWIYIVIILVVVITLALSVKDEK